jgi:DNA helicase-2/ATP-dependent DNA helicase PcrA
VGITRAERDLYICYARTRAVFGSREWGIPSRFIGEIPKTLTDWSEQEQERRSFQAGRAPSSSRARAMTWSGSSEDGPGWGSSAAAPPVAYRLGEDVAHPTFGDGVVTGIEPGGIVVVRFSRDRTERKLVADLAPITRR